MKLERIVRGRIDRTLSAIALILLSASVAACTQASASPAAPSSASTPKPTTPAPAGFITLRGQITEARPTTLTWIESAVVAVTDGPDAGRSAVADSTGFYTLTGLTPGAVNLAVSAADFVAVSRPLQLAGDTIADFTLMPVPKTVTDTVYGDIASTDGTCSDGTADRACRVVVIPIHNSGAANATLTWTGSSTAKLAITLFQTGVESPIARSADAGANQQQVGAMLKGGEDYEFRITFAAGAGSATYALRVSHMN